MMNTAGMTTVCQISKVVATPSALTCQGRKSQTFGTPSSLALCWKKSCLMSIHERWTILTNLLQRTLVQLTPSSTFPTQRYHALVHIQRTSYFWRAIVFGVLPPVSKLNLAQTLYHFISGYTALVAGTEDGIKEPTATFSACFGAAFIMLHPTKYAAMLAEKMQKHGATGWLVNTGWSGGSYGSGKRIKLPYTRKIIDAIHSGSLLNAKYKKTEVFGLEIPTEVEGVPSEILDPVNTWSDKNAYNETLMKLAGLFKRNFETFTNYKIGKDNKLTEEILAAGPNF